MIGTRLCEVLPSGESSLGRSGHRGTGYLGDPVIGVVRTVEVENVPIVRIWMNILWNTPSLFRHGRRHGLGTCICWVWLACPRPVQVRALTHHSTEAAKRFRVQVRGGYIVHGPCEGW